MTNAVSPSSSLSYLLLLPSHSCCFITSLSPSLPFLSPLPPVLSPYLPLPPFGQCRIRHNIDADDHVWRSAVSSAAGARLLRLRRALRGRG